jgi:hypothetical protein
MSCGICIAAERNWDPQYLRNPGKVCEAHLAMRDEAIRLIPIDRSSPTTDMWDFDAGDDA